MWECVLYDVKLGTGEMFKDKNMSAAAVSPFHARVVIFMSNNVVE